MPQAGQKHGHNGLMIATVVALLALQAPTQAPNTLTSREVRQGWKLLFDGKTTNGWVNWKSNTLNPGWQVKDGTLAVVDPNNAGDIVTTEKYEWFEFELDFNLGKGQNSGIMFRVGDDGGATWHSGPEIQLYDYRGSDHAQKSGFLYELYASETDATKPGGEWNHMRILISPKKCETVVNGVKYYEFVLGSDDFKARVAKSKFAEFPNFGKLPTGRIAIQGDHGVVAFKNMKIRVIKAK